MNVTEYHALKASVTEQHYSPSTGELLNSFDYDPPERLIEWLEKHTDAILVFQADKSP